MTGKETADALDLSLRHVRKLLASRKKESTVIRASIYNRLYEYVVGIPSTAWSFSIPALLIVRSCLNFTILFFRFTSENTNLWPTFPAELLVLNFKQA